MALSFYPAKAIALVSLFFSTRERRERGEDVSQSTSKRGQRSSSEGESLTFFSRQ